MRTVLMAKASNKYQYYSIVWLVIAVVLLFESAQGTITYINTGIVHYFRDSAFVFEGASAIAALIALYLISSISIYACYKYYKAYKTGGYSK